MSYQNFHLIYVASPMQSAEFYSKLLELTPIEQSPGFALFALPSGLMLGMWLKTAVTPMVSTTQSFAGTELAFAVATQHDVELWHTKAQQLGVDVLQAPTTLDFGYSLTLADLDGHRVRVFCPSMD